MGEVNGSSSFSEELWVSSIYKKFIWGMIYSLNKEEPHFTIENYITCLQAFKWNNQILFQTGIIELNFPFTPFSQYGR